MKTLLVVVMVLGLASAAWAEGNVHIIFGPDGQTATVIESGPNLFVFPSPATQVPNGTPAVGNVFTPAPQPMVAPMAPYVPVVVPPIAPPPMPNGRSGYDW